MSNIVQHPNLQGSSSLRATSSSLIGRGGSWHRLRVQLVGGALAVLLPYAVLTPFYPGPSSIAILQTSALGSLLATCVGLFVFRSVSRYPGVEASAYILPSFGFSYGLMLLVFLFSRFGYSRLLLLSAFVLTLSWFYLTYSMTRKGSRLRIGVVPSSGNHLLGAIDQVDWFPLVSADKSVAGLDAVAVDLRADLPDEWERRLTEFALQGLPVYHTKHLAESLTGRVELEHLSENTFGTLSPIYAFMKTKAVIDWAMALAVVVLSAPLLGLIALLIRFDSEGPVIFKQRRIGYRGEPFTMLKFRTMRPATTAASDARDAAMTKTGDDRVTRVGAFLRRTRLDELPQLFNVLRGEMSWIGPRPEAEVLSRWYEAEIPFYRYRHIVKPGITGWAQVNQGHVAEVEEVTSKLFYDFYYIKHFSPWIDLLIVARTVRTMLTGFGSK